MSIQLSDIDAVFNRLSDTAQIQFIYHLANQMAYADGIDTNECAWEAARSELTSEQYDNSSVVDRFVGDINHPRVFEGGKIIRDREQAVKAELESWFAAFARKDAA